MKRFLVVAAAALTFVAPAAMAQSYGGHNGQGSYPTGEHSGRSGGYGYGQRWNGGYYADQGRRFGYNDREYRHERRDMRRAERREHGDRRGYRGW